MTPPLSSSSSNSASSRYEVSMDLGDGLFTRGEGSHPDPPPYFVAGTNQQPHTPQFRPPPEALFHNNYHGPSAIYPPTHPPSTTPSPGFAPPTRQFRRTEATVFNHPSALFDSGIRPLHSHHELEPIDTGRRPSGMVGSATGWTDDAPALSVAGSSSSRGSIAGAPSSNSSSSRSKKATAPRARTSKSCSGCRKRKVACDRISPCSQCTERNEAHLCVWDDGVPLFSVRSESDTLELKAQIDRLQGLVDVLTNPSVQTAIAALSSPVPTLEVSTSTSYAYSPSAESTSAPSSQRRRSSQATAPNYIGMRESDLAEGIAQLSLAGSLPVEKSGGDLQASDERLGPLLEDVRRRCEAASSTARPISANLDLLSPSLSSISLSDDLYKSMPSDHEGNIAWQHFAASSGSAFVPLHEPTFERQRQELDAARREGKPPNLHFVATFLAVCASGLASMPVEEASRSGSVSDVQALSSRWIGLAHRALLAGRFLEAPTLEGVRAATLIALFHLNLSPEDGTAFALGLLGIAVQAAMSLGLHRTESMQREAHVESAVVHREGRRRVFYGLFCATVHAHSLFGVSWSAFESTRVQATFPLECSSELVRSGAVESPVAALICHCRIAVLANKITRLYNGTSTVSYNTIMEMNAELSEAELAVPLAYKLREDAIGNLLPLPRCPSATELRAMSIQATIALQFLRLHRPWLQKPGFDLSRDTCLAYARRICALAPHLRSHPYLEVSASSVLSLILLSTPAGAPLSNELCATLAESADRLRRRGRHSEIALKGSAVLDHVLRLHSTPDPSDLAPPPKRARSSPISQRTSPNPPPLPTSWTAPELTVPFRPALNTRQSGNAGHRVPALASRSLSESTGELFGSSYHASEVQNQRSFSEYAIPSTGGGVGAVMFAPESFGLGGGDYFGNLDQDSMMLENGGGGAMIDYNVPPSLHDTYPH